MSTSTDQKGRLVRYGMNIYVEFDAEAAADARRARRLATMSPDKVTAQIKAMQKRVAELKAMKERIANK